MESQAERRLWAVQSHLLPFPADEDERAPIQSNATAGEFLVGEPLSHLFFFPGMELGHLLLKIVSVGFA